MTPGSLTVIEQALALAGAGGLGAAGLKLAERIIANAFVTETGGDATGIVARTDNTIVGFVGVAR